MSKISLTVCIPHEKKDGKIKPQFYVSCSNNSYLSVNGKDIRGARWGNSNVNQGYKNRFEYGCTAAKGITNLSLWVIKAALKARWCTRSDLMIASWTHPQSCHHFHGPWIQASQHPKKTRKRRKNVTDPRTQRDREPLTLRGTMVVGHINTLPNKHDADE